MKSGITLLLICFFSSGFSQKAAIVSEIEAARKKVVEPYCIIKRVEPKASGTFCSNPGIELSVSRDSLCHFSSGEVVAVFKMEDLSAIIIRTGHFYYTYSGPISVLVKKKDFINSSTVLGILNLNENCSGYDFDFLMADEKAKFYSSKEILDHFKENKVLFKTRSNVKGNSF